MSNTLFVLGAFAFAAVAFTVGYLWFRFWFNRSDGEWWGFYVAMSPLPIGLLSAAIIADLWT